MSARSYVHVRVSLLIAGATASQASHPVGQAGVHDHRRSPAAGAQRYSFRPPTSKYPRIGLSCFGGALLRAACVAALPPKPAKIRSKIADADTATRFMCGTLLPGSGACNSLTGRAAQFAGAGMAQNALKTRVAPAVRTAPTPVAIAPTDISPRVVPLRGTTRSSTRRIPHPIKGRDGIRTRDLPGPQPARSTPRGSMAHGCVMLGAPSSIRSRWFRTTNRTTAGRSVHLTLSLRLRAAFTGVPAAPRRLRERQRHDRFRVGARFGTHGGEYRRHRRALLHGREGRGREGVPRAERTGRRPRGRQGHHVDPARPEWWRHRASPVGLGCVWLSCRRWRRRPSRRAGADEALGLPVGAWPVSLCSS